MRAIVFDRTLRFDPDYPEPVPGKGECLIRVHMAGVCATDLQVLQGYMAFSGVLGHELVGTVEVGSAQWKGRRVACEINCVCRKCDMCLAGLALHCRNRTVMGIDGRDGCFADLIAMPEANLHLVLESVSDEEAVFIEPLAAAYHVPLQCNIERRMTVSVLGAGRLGLLMAQAIASTGCKLTVIGRNPMKLELCEKRGIQAIHVDDFVPAQDRDIVVDCTGSPDGLTLAMSTVRPHGTIVLKSTCVATADSHGVDLSPIVVNEIAVRGSRCGPFSEAVNALARQAVEVRSLITKTYPIEQGVEAIAAASDPNHVKILLKINPR